MAWLTSLTIIWVWMRDWRAMVFLMLCFSSNSKDDPLENGKVSRLWQVSRLWLTSDEALWSSFSIRPSSAMPDFKDPWSSKWSLGSVRFRVSNRFLKSEKERLSFLWNTRARSSSLFIEFEFNRVSNCRVQTYIKLDFCPSISNFGSSLTSFSGLFRVEA